MDKWIGNIVKNGNDDVGSSDKLISHFGELTQKYNEAQNNLKTQK